MKESKKMTEKVQIPEGVEVKVEGPSVIVKGQKGELKRTFLTPSITATVEDKNIVFIAEDATKREKMMMGTFKAHVKNMFKGCTEGHLYKLKVCSGHFPMNVSVNNNQFIVKNFIGEKVPRILDIRQDVTVKVEGQDVVVESNDKEAAGQVASRLERLTRRPGFDKRIFMDGIYITEKDGKPVRK